MVEIVIDLKIRSQVIQLENRKLQFETSTTFGPFAFIKIPETGTGNFMFLSFSEINYCGSRIF